MPYSLYSRRYKGVKYLLKRAVNTGDTAQRLRVMVPADIANVRSIRDLARVVCWYDIGGFV